MGARVITQEIYDLMLTLFRQNHSQAGVAQQVRSSRVTVKRAYEHGWPSKGMLAIRDVIEDEKLAARAQRQAKEEERIKQVILAREQAQQDAITARSEEARGAKLTRTNALGMSAISNRLLVTTEKIVKEIENRVVSNITTMDTDDLRKLVDTTARMVQRAQTTMMLALQIERVVTGEPIATIGVQVSQLTPEQMLEEAKRMLRSAERGGWLSTVEEVNNAPDTKN